MKKMFRHLLPVLVLICLSGSALSQIVINEFTSKNDSLLADSEGEYNDWIELYNRSDSTVSLKNFSISDDAADHRKYIFGDLSMPAGSFLLLFASGRDTVIGGEIHLSFKITSEGEPLLLSDAKSLIDSLAPLNMGSNISFGRTLDGGTVCGYFAEGTPGFSNTGLEVFRYHNKLGFSREPGFYGSDFSLDVTSMLEGAAIYYTTDGTIPDEGAEILNGGLLITDRSGDPDEATNVVTWPDWSPWPHPELSAPVLKGTVLRLQAYLNGKKAGDMYTMTYFVLPDSSRTFTLPVVSVVTSPACLFDPDSGIYIPGNAYTGSFTGNYSNRGREWERLASFEYIDETNTEVVNQAAGIRIEGATSQIIPNKALRIYARDEYGRDRITYPFFSSGITDFKKLLLRPSGQDFHLSFIRDILAHRLAAVMQLDYQDYRPVILFMNGEYWGINYLREIEDENYLESHYRENDDEFIIGEDSPEFQEFITFIKESDVTDPLVYAQIRDELAVDSYINYTLLEMFSGRWDYMNRSPWKHINGKWRFFATDYDAAFCGPCALEEAVEQDMVKYLFTTNIPCWYTSFPCNSSMCQPKYSNVLISKLITNTEFRTRFLELAGYHLKYTFGHEAIAPMIEELHAVLSPEMQRHAERWNAPESMTAWEDEIANVATFCDLRKCIFTGHLKKYFALSDSDFGETECATGFGPSILSESDEKFSLYPNPAEDELYVSLNSACPENLLIRVYDNSGRLVLEERVLLGEDPVLLKNFSTLPGGMYFFQLSGEKITEFRKIVRLE